MSYKNRAKVRKLKMKLTKIVETLKFRWLHLSISSKIILFWTFASFTSLFFPWVNSISWEFSWNWFSNLAWKSWFLLLILQLIILFFIFSFQKKEKIKLFSSIHFKDYLLFIIWWIFMISLSFLVLSFIWGLHMLSDDIIYWKWIIVNLIWGFLIFIWGFLIRIEENKSTKSLFLNEKWLERDELFEKEEKNNMKLPF